MLKKQWIVEERNLALENELSRELNITPLVSRILINRGIKDIRSGRDFLHVSESNLLDPFLLNDMERAVDRLIRGIERKERILIYGDYDVDGVTASALFTEFFRGCGVETGLHIPDRITEGYSLNEAAVEMARSKGYDLILTADCGTSSFRPVELAQGYGIDVIVTDHHEAPEELPPAFALINPNRIDSTYPFKGLTGVGVAFKMIQAVAMSMKGRGRSGDISLSRYLDLVALGTIADVAPLTGENRYFVKEGLTMLSREKRVGISALKKVSGQADKEVSVGTVAFMLAPRINAAGRLARADIAVSLLTTSSEEDALSAARYLDQVNQERQRTENGIREEVRERILRETDPEKEKVIVMSSREWHQGVIGIVASKIVDEFYRPCILISVREDGTGKGSARSIPHFNIYRGLEACRDLLDNYGGHKYAAGLTIQDSQIPLLRQRLSDLVGERVKEEQMSPQIVMDAEIDLEDINFPLLKEMALLPPYGMANPEPVIMTKGMRAMEPRIVGRDHLKIKLRQGRAYLDSIGFGMGSAYNEILNSGKEVDAAYTPELNLWNGTYGLQLKLKDIRPSE